MGSGPQGLPRCLTQVCPLLNQRVTEGNFSVHVVFIHNADLAVSK